jgi:preprotein translocase subunit Sss1
MNFRKNHTFIFGGLLAIGFIFLFIHEYIIKNIVEGNSYRVDLITGATGTSGTTVIVNDTPITKKSTIIDDKNNQPSSTTNNSKFLYDITNSTDSNVQISKIVIFSLALFLLIFLAVTPTEDSFINTIKIVATSIILLAMIIIYFVNVNLFNK